MSSHLAVLSPIKHLNTHHTRILKRFRTEHEFSEKFPAFITTLHLSLVHWWWRGLPGCLPHWCILLATASNNNNHINRHNNTPSAILRGDYFRPQIFILHTQSHNTNFNTLPFHTWEHNQSLTLGWRLIELPLGCAHFRFFFVFWFWHHSKAMFFKTQQKMW